MSASHTTRHTSGGPGARPQGERDRLKVLLSAFACAPNTGSEPEVGFQTLRVAASHHDVWVLTQPHMAERTAAHLRDDPPPGHVELVPVEPTVPPRRPGLRTWLPLHRAHDRWQRNAADTAVRLDRDIDFDVVHHVTLAAFWTRAGVAAVDKPLVWGPVGGAVDTPRGLLPELGVEGFAEDALRFVVRKLAARTPTVRQTMRRAAVTFAANEAAARALRRARNVTVMSNGLCVNVEATSEGSLRTKDVVFAGRLVPWKGAPLAVRAFALTSTGESVLRLYGNGPQRAAVIDAARRYGVTDRVELMGSVPRRQLLDDVARAGALLHPSLHDEGALIVAEALSLGTPVVCLDHGGPAELTRQWPGVASRRIRPRGARRTAMDMAAALDDMLGLDLAVAATVVRPSTSFPDAVLAAYEHAAATRSAA